MVNEVKVDEVSTDKINTEVVTTEVVVNNTQLANVDIKTLMNNDDVQSIIKEQMKESTEQWKEVELFISWQLESIFQNWEIVSQEIEKLYDLVINNDEVRSELSDIFKTYSDVQNSVVTTALRNLDDEIWQVAKPIRLIKSTIEDSASLWKRFLKAITFQDDNKIIANSVSGVEWRVNSITLTLNKAKNQVITNQQILKRIVPKIGMRIAKLNWMALALNRIVTTIPDLNNNTKTLLNDVSLHMQDNAASLLEDLQKINVLVNVNVNNKNLITKTERKILSKITSSILVNFIAWSETAIKDMASSVDASLAKLDDENTKAVVNLMKMEENEKIALKTHMEDILTNIDELSKDITSHNENMDVINKDIANFLPEYKEKLANVEKNIYNDFWKDSSKSVMLLEMLRQEATELWLTAEESVVKK